MEGRADRPNERTTDRRTRGEGTEDEEETRQADGRSREVTAEGEHVMWRVVVVGGAARFFSLPPQRSLRPLSQSDELDQVGNGDCRNVLRAAACSCRADRPAMHGQVARELCFGAFTEQIVKCSTEISITCRMLGAFNASWMLERAKRGRNLYARSEQSDSILDESSR